MTVKHLTQSSRQRANSAVALSRTCSEETLRHNQKLMGFPFGSLHFPIPTACKRPTVTNEDDCCQCSPICIRRRRRQLCGLVDAWDRPPLMVCACCLWKWVGDKWRSNRHWHIFDSGSMMATQSGYSRKFHSHFQLGPTKGEFTIIKIVQSFHKFVSLQSLWLRLWWRLELSWAQMFVEVLLPAFNCRNF